jgi:hypothetical protein
MWSYGSGWDASYADGSSQTCGFCSTSQATAAVRIGGNHIYGLQVLANVITPGGYAISTPGFSVDPTGIVTAQTFSGALTGHASLDLPLAGGTVTGGTTFSGSGTGLAVTNNATIGGTLGVTGAATFSGGLTGALTGHASLDFPLTGGSTITGNVLTTQTVFANGFSIYGGAYGVSCTGTPTSSFQSVNGIVIHC